MPAEAKGISRKAAVAFVHHVIEVLNYSAATQDGSALEELQTRTCAACNGIRSRLREVRSEGGVVEGGAWTPLETLVLRGVEPERQVQVVVSQQGQVLRRQNGSIQQRFKPGRSVYVFHVRPDAGSFVVSEISKASP